MEKIKRVMRDDDHVISEEAAGELAKELGDILWYVTAICSDLGISLGDVAEGNLQKLQSRAERGVLSGKGDNR
jgi:NTP pyrophosphatase (non-canonical NTP hydrolase)